MSFCHGNSFTYFFGCLLQHRVAEPKFWVFLDEDLLMEYKIEKRELKQLNKYWAFMLLLIDSTAMDMVDEFYPCSSGEILKFILLALFQRMLQSLLYFNRCNGSVYFENNLKFVKFPCSLAAWKDWVCCWRNGTVYRGYLPGNLF